VGTAGTIGKQKVELIGDGAVGVAASPCSSLSCMLSSSSYHGRCFHVWTLYQETQQQMMMHSVAHLFLFEPRNHVETAKAVANQLRIMLSALVAFISVQKLSSPLSGKANHMMK